MRWFPLFALFACKPAIVPYETDPATPTDTGDTDPDTDDTDVPLPTPPPTPLTDPEAAGPMGFTTRVTELDRGYEQTLQLRVFEPATPGSKIALVVPGFSMPANLYNTYGEHLASHGYATVIIGLRANVFNLRSQAVMASDISAVIDWIEGQGGGLANVDTSRVVIAGHSLGGKLAFLTALNDSRVFGVIGLDPVDASPGTAEDAENPSIAPERMGEIDFPLVVVGEDTNNTDCAPQGQNYRDYFDAATSPAVRVEILDADHMQFLDDPDCGPLCNLCPDGTADGADVLSFAHGATLAYFEHILAARDGARQYLIAGQSGRTSVNVKNGF